MKQHLAELLTYAVGNTYGGYYTPVFSALTEYGRLTLRALSQITGQPLEAIAQAISGLVQQNLVLYFAGADRSSDSSYEPNWENAYNLTIRAGTLVKLITARHGKEVGSVFCEIMVAGIVRVGDLIQRVTEEPEKHDSPQKGSVNGDAPLEGEVQTGKRTAEDTEAAIYTLIKSGVILPCVNRQFWPSYDLHQEAETQVKSDKWPAGCNTKRERDACAQDVEDLLCKWRDEVFTLGTRAPPRPENVSKRGRSPDEDDTVSNKRQKIANGINGNRAGHNTTTLDTNLELAVNYEKCTVALRTVQFARWAARHVGSKTGAVYEAALAVLEGKMLRCHDPYTEKWFAEKEAGLSSMDYPYNYDDLSPPLTAREVAALVDKNINLDQSLPTNGTNGTNGHCEDVVTNEHAPTTYERVAMVEQHLAILCADQREFLVREAGAQSWRIPFRSLTQKLIQAEVESTITARFGKLPAACARILNANGVLDVKQMALHAIVKADQVQMAITPLLEAGYASAQELPRDNSRTVERSIWAYSFNAVHARQRLLDDTYKTLARLFQRLEYERGKRRMVLEKSARTDVAANEMRYLTAKERESLRRCRELEDFIDRYIIRIDQLIAVTRDFNPMVPAKSDFDQVRGHKHLNL